MVKQMNKQRRLSKIIKNNNKQSYSGKVVLENVEEQILDQNGNYQIPNGELTNLNLITQAKNMSTVRCINKGKTQKKFSTTSEASASNRYYLQAQQHKKKRIVVAPISNKSDSSSTTELIVCLGVNKNPNTDSENEIELGEVVRVDKIKKKAAYNDLISRDYDVSADTLTPDPSPTPITPPVRSITNSRY